MQIDDTKRFEGRELTLLCSDLGFVTLGLRESGCKLVFSCPLKEGRAQICTLIHAQAWKSR